MAGILIIDDQARMRQMIRRALSEGGHSVTEASNGAEGVQEAARARPDLVICDIVMPGQEGIETIRMLRASYPDLPILAISGSAPEKDLYLKMAVQLGATASLAKPFRIEELRQATERLLSPGP